MGDDRLGRFRVDRDEVWQGVRAGLAGGIGSSGGGLALGLMLGFLELQYALFGVVTEGQVTEVYALRSDPTAPRGPSGPVQVVRFNLVDRARASRTGVGVVRPPTQHRPGDSVRVEYVPGEDVLTRLESQRQRGVLYGFVACFGLTGAAIGFGVFRLAREANDFGVRPRPRGAVPR